MDRLMDTLIDKLTDRVKKMKAILLPMTLDGNETLERVEEHVHLGQTVSANPAHDKEIKRRTGEEWSAFGKQGDIMISNLPRSLKREMYN